MTALTLTAAPRITAAWRQTLQVIRERPGISLSDLARARGVALSTISVTVGVLERHGWVRTRRKQDAPRLCRLTEAGRAALEEKP